MGFLRVIRVNLIPGIVGLTGIQSCLAENLAFTSSVRIKSMVSFVTSKTFTTFDRNPICIF